MRVHSLGWVKINIDRDILVLLLVEVFFVGVYWGPVFLDVQTDLVARFMKLYMLWKKFNIWDLLMYDLNVILSWFVLCLLLELLFRGCFIIDGILVLIIVRESCLGLLIFFVKGMHVLIS